MATQMLQFPLGGGYIRTCFCIGQRDAPDSLAPALAEAVERHITEYGVGEFAVGRYGHFDYLVAQAVIEAKTHHPSVRLVYLRPYHPADQPIDTPQGFDNVPQIEVRFLSREQIPKGCFTYFIICGRIRRISTKSELFC